MGQLGAFEAETFWSYDELSTEMEFCFEQLDEVEGRPMLGGQTRQDAYHRMHRAPVNREQFFSETVKHRQSMLQRTAGKLNPSAAWRYAVKDVLKKYDLVRYWRP